MVMIIFLTAARAPVHCVINRHERKLASMVDATVTPGPTLPVGHPFTNVRSDDYYWSATTYAANPTPTIAWFVTFINGSAGGGSKSDSGLA
jgi:hypothetical protein